MNRLTKFQRGANQQSAGHWRLAEEHRRRVMQLIQANAPAPGGRLCVLGAGNCNDLELPALVQQFSEVALVDLDEEALRTAAARQGVSDAAPLMLFGGVDLTGVWDELEQLAISPENELLIESIVSRATHPKLPAPNDRFDLVVSTCVLSQLIKGVADAVRETHRRFLDLVAAIRLGHLRLLTELAAPAGRMLLVTDFVSSDSAPEIATVPTAELDELSRRLLEGGNFFHGLNPAVLASLWRGDPELAAASENLRVARPWRWDFGPRMYLVTAFQLERR